jgi:hypothetical protein
MNLTKSKIKVIIAYVAAVLSLIIIGLWSYWGINEAFHEGWYYTSLWQNISLTFIQYLSVPIAFLFITLVSLHHKRIGAALFIVSGIFAFFFFNSNAGRTLICIPLLLFAAGYYFGEFKHKQIVSYSFIAVFLLQILIIGVPQLIRVENRLNDHNFGLRIIAENGVNLSWAPEGIGFPLKGTDWETAKDICARLNADGAELEEKELNIWRLPTREELVRSLTKKNINSGGSINEEGIAEYKINPDKETPLWNPNSQVIYYWTNEAKNEKYAYLVAYNGFILSRAKASGAYYQGYRCVKPN